MEGLKQTYKYVVLVEGSIGDSLVLIPTLRLIADTLGESGGLVLSLSPASRIDAKSVLSGTFKEFGFHCVDRRPASFLGGKFGAWLSALRVIRQVRAKTVVYALKPDHSGFSRRAKAHKRFLDLFCRGRLIGFDGINKYIPSTSTSDQAAERVSELLFKRLARSLKPEANFSDYSFELHLSAAESEFATAWIADHIRPQGQAYYVVCVTAKTVSKCWDVSNYIAVIRHLHEHCGLVPVLVGAEADREVHRQVIEESGVGVSSAGLSVLQNAAIIAGAEFYLGNDTGVMHLAAAVSVSCVAIFSSRDVQGLWNPLGNIHKVHEHRVPCELCRLDECSLEEQICLTRIDWQAVASSCESIVQAKQAG